MKKLTEAHEALQVVADMLADALSVVTADIDLDTRTTTIKLPVGMLTARVDIERAAWGIAFRPIDDDDDREWTFAGDDDDEDDDDDDDEEEDDDEGDDDDDGRTKRPPPPPPTPAPEPVPVHAVWKRRR
jgi:hypothetical protein